MPKRFAKLQKKLPSTIHAKVDKSVRKYVGKEMQIMMDRLSYSADKLDKGDVNLCELINLMKDMVRLLDSASVFEKAKAEGEKVSLKEEMALELAKEAKAKAAEEAKIVYKAKANTQGDPQPINTTSSKEAKVEAQGEQSSKAPPVTELIPHV
ncbi:hypothetical protein Tco_0737244 [Tanacetum coccineum]